MNHYPEIGRAGTSKFGLFQPLPNRAGFAPRPV